ncbi:MAG TPA: hypothetical protein VNN72_24565 [Polyangiaceae bacterium]|nr:hypothetical protein [Polyangiaceae bacterium]
MVRGSLVLAALVVLVALPVRAEQAAAETAALSWVLGDGAETCPAEGDVADAIAEQLRRRAFVPREQAELLVEAKLAANPAGGFRVVITMFRGDEVVGRRDLESEGPSCQIAAENAALVIALAIDPEASLERVPITAAKEPPSPPPPVASAPPRAEPAKPQLNPAPAPLTPPWQGDLELAAGVVSGTVPDIGVALFVRGRALPPSWPFSVELEAAFVPSQSVDLAPGKGAHFTEFHGGAAMCSRPPRASSLWGAVCAGANVGAVSGQAYGYEVTPPFRTSTVALAARGRVGLRVVRGFSLVVGPDLEIPLKRDYFEAQSPDATEPVFRSSALGLGFELGMVWEL